MIHSVSDDLQRREISVTELFTVTLIKQDCVINNHKTDFSLLIKVYFSDLVMFKP